MSTRIDAFVVATPGLEVLVQAELTRLGVRPANVTHGGVNCALTWPQLWAVHLKSRIATRVLVRVARFKADGFDTLHTGVGRIDWARAARTPLLAGTASYLQLPPATSSYLELPRATSSYLELPPATSSYRAPAAGRPGPARMPPI